MNTEYKVHTEYHAMGVHIKIDRISHFKRIGTIRTCSHDTWHVRLGMRGAKELYSQLGKILKERK